MTEVIPLPVRQDLQATAVCATCRNFEQLHKLASSLADTDAITARSYFRLVDLVKPGRLAHMAQKHPALHAYESQAAEERRRALNLAVARPAAPMTP